MLFLLCTALAPGAVEEDMPAPVRVMEELGYCQVKRLDGMTRGVT